MRNPPPFGIVSKEALELLERQDEVRFLYPELKEFLGDDLKRIAGGKVRERAHLLRPRAARHEFQSDVDRSRRNVRPVLLEAFALLPIRTFLHSCWDECPALNPVL